MVLEHQIYQDNLDVDLLIDGDEWSLIEAEIQLTLSDTADYVNFVIAPTPSTRDNLPDDPTLPEGEGGLLGTELTLDVDTELVAGDRDQEITRLFTGNLANLSAMGNGAWSATGFDPSYKAFASGSSFMNELLYLPAASGAEDYKQTIDPAFLAVSYGQSSYNTPSGTKIQASELVQLIMEEADITDYEIVMDAEGVSQGTTSDGVENFAGYDFELYFSDSFIKVKDALERLTTSTQSEWWFDRFGKLYIGAPTPGNPVNQWTLQFITDADAGKTTPAYRSVQIIGSGVVSEEGWNRTAMNEEDPITLTTNLNDADADTEDLAKPVFTYRNMSIQTRGEAEAARNKILNKLRDQQKSGKITVVGMPEVRPYDTIEMPNSEIQPMGGERYGVVKVVHKLNESDGFTTVIHVGALRNEQEVMYADEIPEPEYGTDFRAFLRPGQRARGSGI